MCLSQQFGLLLWKNYLLQKRQTLVTVVELALPLLFSCVVICLRLYAPLGENHEDHVFETFSVNTLPDLSSTQDGKLNGSFQLAYVPSGYTAVQQVAEYVQQSLEDNTRNDYQNLGWPPGSHITSVRGFETEQQFEDYVRNDNESGKVLAAVVFEHTFSHLNEPLSRQVRYRLRFPYNPRSARERTHRPPMMVSPLRGVQSNWHTHHLFAVSQQPGPRTSVRGMDKGGVPDYYEQGFLALQHAVDQAIMRSYNRTSADSLLNRIRVRLSRFPEPAHRLDYFIVAIQPILPLLLMLSFTYTSLNIVRAVVQEKETKLKEYMRMMGLNNWLHWSAWFLTFFLLLFVSIFFVTLLLCLPMSPEGAVLSHSDPTLVFVFLLVFAVATINFNFMISTFFSRADVAAAAGGFIYFLSFMPYMFLGPRYELLSHAQKTSACLISNIAMGMGAQLLGSFEGKGTGIQWSNLFDPVTVDDDLTMALVLGLLLLDALMYGLVAWYMETVFPGEYGVPLPYYFFILPSYWCSSPHTAPVNGNGEGEDVGNAVKGEFMEEEPTGMVSGIKIKHLTKEFKVGRKTWRAVRDLTVNMFEGQITVLLGHNGAGKTTALSMLTGLFPPTSGRAYINGYDICHDMALIRHSLGYCPQHNVLFDNLTVREHLLFYAQLKGFPRDQVLAEVDQIIRNLNLEDKRQVLSKTLSGGMKRKLSIGIALTGNSKVVMLDEPTSGIDPSARRAIWDLLQGEKRGRTIVLTTHFMDEADLLGDRIAIMTGGELQCCGSPLFLKNRYGAGYHMVIVKDVNCNVFEITCLVHKYVPNAKLESNVGAELSYILPKESTDSFELLFSELEVNRQKLGITSYGASLTTMEEVFLRVGKLVDSSLDIQAIQLPALQHDSHQQSTDDAGSTGGMADHTDITDSRMLSSEDFTNLKLNTGLRLYLQQFYAMFLKRALYSLRNWKVMVAQFLVPLVFMIATLFALRASPSFPNSPLWLDLRHYGPTTVPMVLEPRDGTLADLAREYECHVKASQAQIIKTTNLNDYILARGKEEGRAFSQQCVVAAAFRGKSSSGGFEEDTAIAYFNDQGYHTSATALMMVDNALFKHLAGSDASIQTGNHPMPPRTRSEGSQTKIFADGFQIAMSLMFGMASLSSTFALLLVKERSVKSRHVQQVSGLHLPNFWFSALLWDLLNFLLPCLLLLGVFRAFAVKAFVEDNRLANVLLILLLYGWAVIPLMYLLSFLFDKAGTAYVRLFIFNIISGLLTTMTVAVMKEIAVNECIVHSGDRAECDSRTAVLLDKMFMIFPNYCLGMSFTQFYHNYLLTSFCTTKGESQAICEYYKLTFEENYFSMSEPGVGRFLVPFLVQGIVFITLLFVIELQIVWTLQRFLGSLRGILGRRLTQRPVTADAALLPEDSDVAEERKRVLECQPAVESMAGNPLILRELSKVYGTVGTLQAVDRLSLAVGKGECFGLLGFNGAGKTTTFKMLTGDESVTSGNAYIDGYSILSDIKKVQRRIGYCPQFDALLDHMTGRETLHMYARLRGIPEKYLSVCAEKVLGSLLLEPHADKLVSAYSGGNKRKLSTGVALIGGPPVLFLDEPSTGMDPVARRLLWDAVTRTRESGKAVVITTHSMEECEALCTRLAVMVNGRLQCLGSPQHLKSKFGSGYTLLAKVARDLEEVDPEEGESKLHRFKRFIEGTFPGSLLKDEHQCMVHYHLTDKTATWARVFGTMEAAKEKYGIGDYSVGQISLEQVFLSFAQFQHYTV